MEPAVRRRRNATTKMWRSKEREKGKLKRKTQREHEHVIENKSRMHFYEIKSSSFVNFN